MGSRLPIIIKPLRENEQETTRKEDVSEMLEYL